MVRDGDVFVPKRVRGFGHFLKGGAAVRFGGVHVKIAADVGKFDQLGQAASRRLIDDGGFHLAAIFAQFGRNPGQAERGVNLFLGFPADAALVLETKQPVFIERKAQLQRPAAHQNIVLLAAGEILHGCAVTFVRERAEVHLKALETILNAGLVGAFAKNGVSFGVLSESLQCIGRARTGDEKIEIANGVLATAQAQKDRGSARPQLFVRS